MFKPCQNDLLIELTFINYIHCVQKLIFNISEEIWKIYTCQGPAVQNSAVVVTQTGRYSFDNCIVAFLHRPWVLVAFCARINATGILYW